MAYSESMILCMLIIIASCIAALAGYTQQPIVLLSSFVKLIVLGDSLLIFATIGGSNATSSILTGLQQ